MKKKLALILAIALVATMFMSVPAMAEDEPTTVTVTSQSALRTAVQSGTADVIILAKGKAFNLVSTADNIAVNRTVTIKSEDPSAPSTIKCTYGGQLPFKVNADGNLTLEDVVLKGKALSGSSSSNASSAIEVNGGTLTLKNCSLDTFWSTSRYDDYGGIIFVKGGTANIIGCSIVGNLSDYSAGVICAYQNSTITVIDSTISGNIMMPQSGSYLTGAGIAADPTSTVLFDGAVVLDNPYNYDGWTWGEDVTFWRMTSDIRPGDWIPGPHVPANNLNMRGAQGAGLGQADFIFEALLELDNVNLIEAEFSYDAEKFSIEAVAVPEGLTVNKIDVWGADNKVVVVLGVSGKDGAFAPEAFESLVSFTLRTIGEEKYETATLTLESATLYAKGEVVDYTILSASSVVALNYKVPGDGDGDGEITAADLSIALYYFGAEESDADWADAASSDVNSDGVVDMADITMLIEAIYG